MFLDFSQTATLTVPTAIQEDFPHRLSQRLLSEAYLNYSCDPTDYGYFLKPRFGSSMPRNSFTPQIRVRVLQEGGQTVLTLEGKPLAFVRGFLLAYMGFALLMEVILLIIAITSGLESIFPVLIPLILIVFGYLLGRFGTKKAFQAVVNTIKRMLQ